MSREGTRIPKDEEEKTLKASDELQGKTRAYVIVVPPLHNQNLINRPFDAGASFSVVN